MKKLVAILLLVAMVLTLVGCGAKESTPAEVPAPGKEEAAKPEKIVFAYMTNNNLPETEDLLRIQNLINEYTIEKINTEVELLLIAQSEYST